MIVMSTKAVPAHKLALRLQELVSRGVPLSSILVVPSHLRREMRGDDYDVMTVEVFWTEPTP